MQFQALHFVVCDVRLLLRKHLALHSCVIVQFCFEAVHSIFVRRKKFGCFPGTFFHRVWRVDFFFLIVVCQQLLSSRGQNILKIQKKKLLECSKPKLSWVAIKLWLYSSKKGVFLLLLVYLHMWKVGHTLALLCKEDSNKIWLQLDTQILGLSAFSSNLWCC